MMIMAPLVLCEFITAAFWLMVMTRMDLLLYVLVLRSSNREYLYMIL
jgi:hypothetical protein